MASRNNDLARALAATSRRSIVPTEEANASSEPSSLKDMIRTGVWLNVLSILVITVFTYFVMPLIWDLSV